MNFNTCLFAFIIALSFSSCGDHGEKNISKKPSKEMLAFTEMLNGHYSQVTSALETFAADSLKENSITRLDLEKPAIVATTINELDQTCYTMEASIGVMTKTFVICWSQDKICSIQDLGFKLD